MRVGLAPRTTEAPYSPGVESSTRSAAGVPDPPAAGDEGDAAHVAAVKVPAVHELVPETVYPESHVGWQVDPLAKELVHVPTTPLVGAVDASQLGTHVAAVSVPAVHELVPETV